MKNPFSRVAITTAVVAAAVVGAAQPASAAEPPTFDAGVACSFALDLSLTGGNLDVRNFVGAENGKPVRTVTAGSTGTLTLANHDTGKSISFRSKGVGSTSVFKNGISTVTYGGQLLLILFDTDIPAGPSTTLYTGRVVYTVDGQGIFTLKTTAGQQVDVCAALEG
jgi:hypothetical protein